MRAQRARLDEIAHAHEMRLEAVIVGGVEHDAFWRARPLQPRERRLVLRDQRLFDKRVLAMFDEIAEQSRSSAASGMQSSAASYASSETSADPRKSASGLRRSTDADKVGAGEAPALVALDAEPDDNDAHRIGANRTSPRARPRRACGERPRCVIGMLPSFSHSQAAAMRADDRRGEFALARQHR